jgi:tetratricopeptide (TPR) repeat protein
VKVLNADSGLGSQGQARLLAEARAAARLNHPNIVAIFDAGRTDPLLNPGLDISFIVMELVEGESLHDQKPSTLEETLGVLQQVCMALQAAHEHGIIHRDLKPENVLRTHEGLVKLSDFGLARSLTTRLSQEGMFAGTVFYIAPEAALGKTVDARTDLYALGVMLYELAAGRLPFTSDDPLAVISQHIHAPAVPPSTYNPLIPQALDDLVLRLLNKRPEDRPGSASEVQAAITDILQKKALSPGVDKSSPLDRLTRGRLIGREEQIATARKEWKQVLTSGQRQPILLISGEAGVGKTPFLREINAMVEVSGARVFSGHCFLQDSAPYTPVVHVLREALPLTEQLLPGLVSASLRNLVPEFASQTGETYTPPIDPMSEQQQLFENMLLLCQTLAVKGPVVIEFEDTQWADGGSLAMIRYLARRIRAIRPTPAIWFILTYRDSDLDPGYGLGEVLIDINVENLAKHIQLPRFSREQTQEILESMFQQSVNPEFTNLVYKVTEGNSLFIEEVCKSLIEEGAIYRDEQLWRLKPDVKEIQLPQSIHLTIQSRITKLDEPTREVLRVAAVIGKEFDFATLKKASGQDEEELILRLEKAERAQLIHENESVSCCPEGEESFSFAHGLIPISLREDLSNLRLHRLHRRVINAIQELRPDDFDRIAFHARQAGDQELARKYTIQAADRALGMFANREAVRYYKDALEMDLIDSERTHVLDGLGEGQYRLGRYDDATVRWTEAAKRYLANNDHDNGARITARAARAEWFTEYGPKALELCVRTLEQIKTMVNDPVELETTGMAYLLHEAARDYRFNNQYDEALPLLRKSLDLAEKLGLVEVQAEALATLGILPNIPPEEARQSLRKAIKLAEGAGLLAAAVRAHNNLSELLILDSDYLAGRAHQIRGRELTQKMGMTDWEFSQLGHIANYSLILGDFAVAENALKTMGLMEPQIVNREYYSLVRKIIQARMIMFQGFHREAITAFEGLLEEIRTNQFGDIKEDTLNTMAELLVAERELERASELLHEAGLSASDEPLTDSPNALCLQAEIYIRKNDLAAARKILDKVSKTLAVNGAVTYQTRYRWALAKWLAAENQFDEALKLYSEITTLVSEKGLAWIRARLEMDWANVLLQRGQPSDLADAREKLSDSAAAFERMGANGYLERVTAQLSLLGNPTVN